MWHILALSSSKCVLRRDIYGSAQYGARHVPVWIGAGDDVNACGFDVAFNDWVALVFKKIFDKSNQHFPTSNL